MISRAVADVEEPGAVKKRGNVIRSAFSFMKHRPRRWIKDRQRNDRSASLIARPDASCRRWRRGWRWGRRRLRLVDFWLEPVQRWRSDVGRRLTDLVVGEGHDAASPRVQRVFPWL